MNKNLKILGYPILGFYFIIVAYLSVHTYFNPYYSYDLVPYVASTISIDEKSPQKIHDETYKVLKELVPTNIYNMFTKGNFGETMATNTKSFYQQLNYYTSKPLYILLIYFIHKLGIDLVKSVYLISILSFIGISILIYLTFRKYQSGIYVLGLIGILMLCQPISLIPGHNTPDSLSAFIILLSLYLILNKKKMKWLPYILLIISVGVRPDNLIICGALVAYFGIFSPKENRISLLKMVGFLCGTLIVYFAISRLNHSYGWSTLFTIAFDHFVPFPADTTVHVGINEYLHALFKNGKSLLSTYFFYFMIVGIMGLIMQNKTIMGRTFHHLIWLMFGVIAIFFILFPSAEVDRYFITEYLVILIATLNIICSNNLPIRETESSLKVS
jgi:hypothetical protein